MGWMSHVRLLWARPLLGIGFPFLKAASESYEKVCELLEGIVAQMKVAMQLSGAANIAQLQSVMWW